MKKNVKTFAVFTVIAALIQAFFLSSVVFAAAAKTYNAAAEFNIKENKATSTWQYVYNEGKGYKNLPFYFKDWGAWRLVDKADPPYSNVYKTQDGKAIALHPDNSKEGKPIDVGVAWRAPSDGKVTIPAASVSHKAYDEADKSKNGTKVWIEFKGKKYGETAIAKNGKATLKAQTFTVKKGDIIYFVANNNKRGGDNETSWPIVVKFTAKGK